MEYIYRRSPERVKAVQNDGMSSASEVAERCRSLFPEFVKKWRVDSEGCIELEAVDGSVIHLLRGDYLVGHLNGRFAERQLASDFRKEFEPEN